MTENELQALMKVMVGSSNQIKSEIRLSKIPQLKVGDVSFSDVGVFNFDFDASPIIQCYTNGGLLGKGVIRQAVWQIDYQHKIIRLADRIEKMPNLEHAVKLKVELDNVLNPFIEVEINGRKQKFLLDFGFGGLISLTEKTTKQYAFSNTIETYGEGAVGANGIQQESMYISPLTTVRIGNQILNNQVAFSSRSDNYNKIGSALARHFIVTLNFKDKELVLTPIQSLSSESFKSFGIDINSNGSEVYISRIYKGLDGEKKGIKLKDSVIAINGITVDSTNLCGSYSNYFRR